MKKTLGRAVNEFDEALGDFGLKLAYWLRIDVLLDFLTAKLNQMGRFLDSKE